MQEAANCKEDASIQRGNKTEADSPRRAVRDNLR